MAVIHDGFSIDANAQFRFQQQSFPLRSTGIHIFCLEFFRGLGGGIQVLRTDRLTVNDVKGGSLTPAQVVTPLRLLRAADCYLQSGVKYPGIGYFHSYSEYLNFGLLEGDPRVSSVVPQCFELYIKNIRYIPDVYFLMSGERHVYEIKPRGEFDESIKNILQEYFNVNGITFSVVSNESILERRIEAENWLSVVRTLYVCRSIASDFKEREIYQSIKGKSGVSVGEIFDLGGQAERSIYELSLFRLLHRGDISIDMKASTFSEELLVTCL